MLIVKVIQVCDGCKETRELSDIPVLRGEISTSQNLGGWREVRPREHLCPRCINKALGREENIRG